MSSGPAKSTKLWLFGSPVSHAAAPGVGNQVFEALGMAPEYYYDRCECPTLKDAPDAPYFDIMRRPETLGSCCTMPLKLEVIEHVDVIDDDARAVGSVNTIFLESEQDGQARWVGTNNDWVGCENPILSALTGISSPFPTDLPRSLAPGTAAGFLIGAGGAVRAAAYALHRLGCSPLYVVNRDPRETEALMAHNSNAFNIVALPLDVGAAQRILDANKLPIVAAIGAIPSSLPITQAEQAVYAIAALVFARPYAAPAPAIGPAHISAPARPIFLDMVYKPFMTRLRTLAETQAWLSIPGTETSAEVVFNQIERWCKIAVPGEVREQARQTLRANAAAAYPG